MDSSSLSHNGSSCIRHGSRDLLFCYKPSLISHMGYPGEDGDTRVPRHRLRHSLSARWPKLFRGVNILITFVAVTLLWVILGQII